MKAKNKTLFLNHFFSKISGQIYLIKNAFSPWNRGQKYELKLVHIYSIIYDRNHHSLLFGWNDDVFMSFIFKHLHLLTSFGVDFDDVSLIHFHSQTSTYQAKQINPNYLYSLAISSILNRYSYCVIMKWSPLK